MTAPVLMRDLVVIACAVSAGAHGALAPEHFREGAAAGTGFVAATLLLGVLAVVLTRPASGSAGLLAAVLVLGGLIAAYALSITVGLPLLHPEADQVDGLALITKVVEAAGLLAALYLLGRAHSTLAPNKKGLQT